MAKLEGTFKAYGVEGSEQYGVTRGGTDQVVVDLKLETGDVVSTFLYFSDAAAPHSIKRLRALGWRGTDLSNLAGIGSEEVDVRVYWEEYEGKENMKVEIVTGGTVVLKDPLDAKGKSQFAKRYANLAASVKAEPKSAPKRAPAPQQRQQRTGTDDFGGDYGGGDDEIPF